jgi:ATP-dependent exoDNAse (exonuclease V) beta subunit
MTTGERRLANKPWASAPMQEAARVFYVAATRATQRLVIGVGGDGAFGNRLGT